MRACFVLVLKAVDEAMAEPRYRRAATVPVAFQGMVRATRFLAAPAASEALSRVERTEVFAPLDIAAPDRLARSPSLLPWSTTLPFAIRGRLDGRSNDFISAVGRAQRLREPIG